EARTQTKNQNASATLPRNQSIGHHPVFAASQIEIGHGACQPPKNSVTAIAETVNMFTYSPIMNMPHLSEEEYPVWNPPTSPPAPSGRRKGSRLVSPTIVLT